jgi:short-subunit dehydrogenase
MILSMFNLGGSKGIGKSIASELIHSGCKTISLVARDRKTLEKAAKELNKECGPGQYVQIYSFDVSEGFEKTKVGMTLNYFSFKSIISFNLGINCQN